MKQGIFQEKAVESLSTPEQLDQRIKIIPSGGWIMFAAIVTGVAAALLWAFFGTVSSGANYQGVVFDYNDVLSVRAQQDGLLRDVLVEEGDQVARGDIIAVINNEESLRRISDLRNGQKNVSKGSAEYEKIEEKVRNYQAGYMLRSTVDGVVQKILLSGQAVEKGDVAAVIVPQDEYSYQEVYIYVPKEDIGALSIGMEAQITPSYVMREEYGYVGTMDYVEELLPSKNCVEVTIQLSVRENGQGGYVWSNPKGEALSIKSGDRCKVRIIKQEYHPYELILKER